MRQKCPIPYVKSAASSAVSLVHPWPKRGRLCRAEDVDEGIPIRNIYTFTLRACGTTRLEEGALAAGHMPVVIDSHHPDDHLYVVAVRVFRAAVTRQALPRSQRGLTSCTLTGGP
jgi:hypothetical protein